MIGEKWQSFVSSTSIPWLNYRNCARVALLANILYTCEWNLDLHNMNSVWRNREIVVKGHHSSIIVLWQMRAGKNCIGTKFELLIIIIIINALLHSDILIYVLWNNGLASSFGYAGVKWHTFGFFLCRRQNFVNCEQYVVVLAFLQDIANGNTVNLILLSLISRGNQAHGTRSKGDVICPSTHLREPQQCLTSFRIQLIQRRDINRIHFDGVHLQYWRL